MRKFDTLPQMERIQTEILRKVKPEQRLKIALELSETSKKLLEEGVRSRHPEYTEQKIKLAVIRILLGEELFISVYPEAKGIKP